MKVVQINTAYGSTASTSRTSKEMHEWLLDRGVGSKVYCVRVDDPGEHSGVELFSSRSDEKIHALLSRITGLQGYFSYGSTKALIKKLQSDLPDVVLLRVLHSNCINFPLLFRFLGKNDIPVVIVLHDTWFLTGHCVDLYEGKCLKWLDKCGKCPRIRDDNGSWFFDTSPKCIMDKRSWYRQIRRMAVVGVSEFMTDKARRSIMKDAKEIRCIYNWIDRKVFRPKEKSLIRKKYGFSEKDTLLLGIASRWMDRKGLQEIVQVGKELRECKLLIIGNWPEEYADEPDNAVFIGTVNSMEVLSDYYNMADVFMNPSWMESFGKTTAEAICCGCRVVAYRTGASEELTRKAGGRLAEPGDIRGFVDAVKQTLEDPDPEGIQREELEFAEEAFEKEKNLEAYLKLFNDITDMRG